MRTVGGEAANGHVWLAHEAIRMDERRYLSHEQDLHLLHLMEFPMESRKGIGNFLFEISKEQGSRGTVKKRINPLEEPFSYNSSQNVTGCPNVSMIRGNVMSITA